MKRLLPVAAAVLVLAGCSSAPSEPAASEGPTRFEVCERLFGDDEVVTSSLDLVQAYAADPLSVDESDVSDAISAIEEAGEGADQALAAEVRNLTGPLEVMQQRLSGEVVPDAVDFQGFKDSGLAIIRLCETAS